MHVFIRHNAIRKSLQPPYDGPFKVIKRAAKFYTILVNGHQQTISLDRLKLAHIDDSPSSTSSVPALPAVTPTPKSTQPSQPPRQTRSGRHVHFPARYITATHLVKQPSFTGRSLGGVIVAYKLNIYVWLFVAWFLYFTYFILIFVIRAL